MAWVAGNPRKTGFYVVTVEESNSRQRYIDVLCFAEVVRGNPQWYDIREKGPVGPFNVTHHDPDIEPAEGN